MKLFLSVILAAIILTVGSPLMAQRSLGILGKEAPSWGVDTWIQLPDEKTRIDVDDFRGKVLYLYCFQSWCPGCHSHGFPTLQALIKKYKEDPDVEFVAVQTVFEGFQTNSPEAGWKTAEKYGLEIPIGHSGSKEGHSTVMSRYRTGGTPWTIVIDRNGTIRYNDFHIKISEAEQLIEALKSEALRSLADLRPKLGISKRCRRSNFWRSATVFTLLALKTLARRTVRAIVFTDLSPSHGGAARAIAHGS